MTAEIALRLGQAAGQLQPRRPSPPRGDRQGHPPLRLHDRAGADRGLHLGRHGRPAGRPAADAGGRHARPLDARRPRRDDLRLAQSLRGQRHQVLRPRRLQALRRGRGGRSRRCSTAATIQRAPPARIGRATRIDDARGRYMEAVKTTFRARPAISTASRSSSIAPTAPPTGRAEVLWELGAEVIPIGVARRLQHQPRLRLDPYRAAAGAVESTAPTSASPRRRRRPGVIVDEKGDARRRRPVDGAHRRPLGARGPAPGGGVVATVMSNLGLERHLDGARPHAACAPRSATATSSSAMRARRLQPRRRAVRPHHDDRLRHDRRRPDRRPAGPLGHGRERQPASEISRAFEPSRRS